ncbi:hypothetical protein AQ505_08975 [Pedobacter sp. PACM 27299]|uniref:RteC domain-containing protein n=1 Tax=Pedobacter sp. PACM 27299 TaxID=1727164 RepID=UPI0007059623|nr:RteC domain-containing protein [Pedobacter sp. PACM 27299]ALL05614.1 hypothetical protein AQ505_08975 [Pedobacter sp. PACM 27299]
MEKLIEKMYQQMMDDLKSNEQSQSPGRELFISNLDAVVRHLSGLKHWSLSQEFSPAQEIWFFKTQKPRFYRWKIFYVELIAIDSTSPVAANEELKEYYMSQLRFIERFFRLHEFHYQYYKFKAKELDQFYFIRGASLEGLLSAELPEVDSSFGTSQDYLVSKFMAYELLQQHLVELVQSPESVVSGTGLKSRKGIITRWTGDSCNLIELIYGIHDTAQVNNGEVDLSDLMDVFEQCFQVNLSRYFRRFTEIKRRKSMSKTRFLDQMREAINKRIDDGDAYHPPLRKQDSQQD